MSKLTRAINEMRKVYYSSYCSACDWIGHSARYSAYYSARKAAGDSAWCSAHYEDNKNIEVFLKVFRSE